MTAAAALAERGFHVFPLKPGEKTPATPGHASNQCSGRDPRCRDGHTGWEPRATTDAERIARGWATRPYNVGVACGPSRLVVVDLDVPKPDEGKVLPEDFRLPGVEDGKDIFALICEWAGMDWPWTYTVSTPSGGWHLYYQAPPDSSLRNSAGLIGPMIDTRANGGYVVGAGSVTAAGAYEVLYDEPVAELPRWIGRLLAPRERPEADIPRPAFASDATKRTQGLVRTVENAQPGTRNDTLFWAAATLAEYAPEDLDQLAVAGLRCGLDNREIEATIASAQRRVAA